jgi:hypothetical protein
MKKSLSYIIAVMVMGTFQAQASENVSGVLGRLFRLDCNFQQHLKCERDECKKCKEDCKKEKCDSRCDWTDDYSKSKSCRVAAIYALPGPKPTPTPVAELGDDQLDTQGQNGVRSPLVYSVICGNKVIFSNEDFRFATNHPRSAGADFIRPLTSNVPKTVLPFGALVNTGTYESVLYLLDSTLTGSCDVTSFAG